MQSAIPSSPSFPPGLLCLNAKKQIFQTLELLLSQVSCSFPLLALIHAVLLPATASVTMASFTQFVSPAQMTSTSESLLKLVPGWISLRTPYLYSVIDLTMKCLIIELVSYDPHLPYEAQTA